MSWYEPDYEEPPEPSDEELAAEWFDEWFGDFMDSWDDYCDVMQEMELVDFYGAWR